MVGFRANLVLCSLLVGCECLVAPSNVSSLDAAVESAPAAPAASKKPLPMVVDAGPPEVFATFSLQTNRKCPEGFPEIGRCYTVRLILHGAVERELLVNKNQWGQDFCRVNRDGVECSGASGGSLIGVRCAPSGSCVVESVDESDGYCPPEEDCKSRSTLASLIVPPGARMIFTERQHDSSEGSPKR